MRRVMNTVLQLGVVFMLSYCAWYSIDTLLWVSPQMERPAALLRTLRSATIPPPYLGCVNVYESVYIISPILYSSISCSDTLYRYADVEYMERFLEMDKTNELKYGRENNDCDDFSNVLLGKFIEYRWNMAPSTISYSMAVGVAHGYSKLDSGIRHAFNFFLEHNHSLYIIEPQTDTITLYREYEYVIDWIYV